MNNRILRTPLLIISGLIVAFAAHGGIVTNFYADFEGTNFPNASNPDGRLIEEGDTVNATEDHLNEVTSVGSWTVVARRASDIQLSTRGPDHQFAFFKGNDGADPYEFQANFASNADLSLGVEVRFLARVHTGDDADVNRLRNLVHLYDSNNAELVRLSIAGTDEFSRLSYFDGTDWITITDDLQNPRGPTPFYIGGWDQIMLDMNSDSFDVWFANNRDGELALVSSEIPYLNTGTDVASMVFANNDPGDDGARARIRYDDISVTTIPEPATVAALFGALALGLVIYRRRCR